MNDRRTAGVIVVGLGAMGAAALYQLAKRGISAIGIDRFAPPHNQGSSHGETRITRLGVGEGEEYGALVKRSHEIWRELEADTGEDLLVICGALILGPASGETPHHGKDDFVRRSRDSALAHEVVHEMLAADEIARRYPQFSLQGDEIGYFEPGGGLVYPERCIAAQLSLAERLGARIVTGERVIGVEDLGAGVCVTTDKDRYQARLVIMSAGAWTPGLAGPALAKLAIQPQTLHWFETDHPSAYRADQFPVFIWMHGSSADDMFYGFPIAPGASTQGLKAARESFFAITDPDAFDRNVPLAQAERVWSDHIQGRLRGVGPRVLKSAACLYTTAPDADFVIDFKPGSPRVLLASACSGHGFKHSAAVGELLARVAGNGDARAIPERFKLNRLAASPASTMPLPEIAR